ncbi:hypothetical protein HaLaN_29005 [Haematococcus lacustris]|uniref:F-box domain-containing protein n=1 Tax=Haematococcus lacustris TaxID=44745 RepID=A0A6A0AD59_HAELA|nr:hypothetical protein HaLaN_29005 [Haematococcus lacustris]
MLDRTSVGRWQSWVVAAIVGELELRRLHGTTLAPINASLDLKYSRKRHVHHPVHRTQQQQRLTMSQPTDRPKRLSDMPYEILTKIVKLVTALPIARLFSRCNRETLTACLANCKTLVLYIDAYSTHLKQGPVAIGSTIAHWKEECRLSLICTAADSRHLCRCKRCRHLCSCKKSTSAQMSYTATNICAAADDDICTDVDYYIQCLVVQMS